MKKAIVAISALILVALTAGMAQASPPGPNAKIDRENGNLRVQIGVSPFGPEVEIDKGDGRLRVGVGSAFSRAERHAVSGVVQSKKDDKTGFDLSNQRLGTVHVLVDGDTRYWTQSEGDKATLDNVPVGGTVNVSGTWKDLEKREFSAKRVQVTPTRVPLWRYAGDVTAYTPASAGAAGSITISDGFNILHTFMVTTETRKLLPEGQTDVKVGDRVAVAGARSDAPTATPTAQSIQVRVRR